MPITSAVDVDFDGSDTDFEMLEEEVEAVVQKQDARSLWQAQFKHLLEFSEDILPTALYEPMKWCYISIRDSMKHIAKTEEILSNMGNDTQLLEMQLEAWKQRQQTASSKSRLKYSINLYRHAGDVFYFAFYQNRGISQEMRAQMEAAFEIQFGSSRLGRTRSLLKLYSQQFGQIEDFLSLLPEIYRSEVLAGLICDYLNPISRDDEKGLVLEKMNELLSSPDYHENQMSLMLLAREDCLFKQVILDSMIKHMITDPLLESATNTSASTTEMMMTTLQNSTTRSDDLPKLKLFLEAEPDLLVRACLATDNMPTSLFDIIATGLNTISVKIIRNRSRIFEDFRPPLFGAGDSMLSLPGEYFRFFLKMKEVPESSCNLLTRVKNALRKHTNNKFVNTQFWQELFAQLNDARSNKLQKRFSDVYHELCRP